MSCIRYEKDNPHNRIRNCQDASVCCIYGEKHKQLQKAKLLQVKYIAWCITVRRLNGWAVEQLDSWTVGQLYG